MRKHLLQIAVLHGWVIVHVGVLVESYAAPEAINLTMKLGVGCLVIKGVSEVSGD
jgi:hypothetical protein